MKETEPPSTGQTLTYHRELHLNTNRSSTPNYSQTLTYHRELPAQFTRWNQFYDELIRLGLLQPVTSVIRIKVFRATDVIKEDESLSVNLVYERQYIERMCLEEWRQGRPSQASDLLTSQELAQLIDLVTNQASSLADWDLLLKLKELLAHQQQQETNRNNIRMTSGE